MKKELNIAAILKEKPKGAKLWSDTYGELILDNISDVEDYPIKLMRPENEYDIELTKEGLYYKNVEGLQPCISPSKEMRSWEKFAWKKGDVLVLDAEESQIYCIFEAFENDKYTLFKSRFACSDVNRNCWLHFNTQSFTEYYEKASDYEAKEFIKKVEEHYGGKLNLETLTIEQPKQEFKDGDIVFVESPFIGIHTKSMIAILNKDTDDGFEFYLALCNKDYDEAVNLRTTPIILNRIQAKVVRPATDSEKQQLFSALEKEGKVWNPDTKQIEDLPKKCEFEPMDWCLMRYKGHYNNRGWELCQYAYTEHRTSYFDNKSKDFYHAVGGEIYAECIPYNDSTKHLLGTTYEWKGGEL